MENNLSQSLDSRSRPRPPFHHRRLPHLCRRSPCLSENINVVRQDCTLTFEVNTFCMCIHIYIRVYLKP